MEKPTITPLQFVAVFSLSLSSVSLSIIPNALMVTAKHDAWIGFLIGYVLSVLILFGLYWFTLRYKRQANRPLTLLQRLFLFLYGVFLFALLTLSVRTFSEVVTTYFLPHTPQVVLAGVLLLTAGYGAWHGLASIGRLSTFTFLLGALAIFSMPLMVVSDIHVYFFHPLLSEPWGAIGYAAIQTIGACVDALFLFGLVPHIAFSSPSGQQRLTLFGWSMFGGFLLLGTLFILDFLLFGPELGGRLVLPTVELVKYLKVTDFLDRLDAVLVSIWTGMMITRISILLWVLQAYMKLFFGLQNAKPLLFPVCLLLTFLSTMLFANISDLLFIYQHFWIFVVLIGIVAYIGSGKAATL